MKNHILYLLLLIFLFSSCEELESVRFSEAQPVNGENLKEFSKKFQGTFVNIEDSSKLIISSNLIIRSYLLNFKDSLNHSDTCIVFTDTIFLISDTHLLRHYKSAYFLNRKTNDNDWTVKKINFDGHGYLSLEKIDPDSMSLIETVTNIEGIKDTNYAEVKYVLNPSKAELKRLIKKGAFSGKEKFKRIAK